MSAIPQEALKQLKGFITVRFFTSLILSYFDQG